MKSEVICGRCVKPRQQAESAMGYPQKTWAEPRGMIQRKNAGCKQIVLYLALNRVDEYV
jgi:hypothetical protein